MTVQLVTFCLSLVMHKKSPAVQPENFQCHVTWQKKKKKKQRHFPTWVANTKTLVARGVVEGPVQVDFAAGAGDAQRAGVVAAEGDEQRALPGWTCGGEQKKQMHEEKKNQNLLCKL